MSKDDEQRIFSVAPEGVASIETAEPVNESPKLPPLPVSPLLTPAISVSGSGIYFTFVLSLR